jgi:hypothetical protein
MPLTNDLLSIRAGSTSGSLLFQFNPRTTIPLNASLITLTPPAGEFAHAGTNAELVCKFIDLSNNNVEYGAKACTWGAGVFTVTAPINTNLTTGSTWGVFIFTKNRAVNGFTYPAPAPLYSIMHGNLNAGAEEFDYDLGYPPALKMTVAKVHANCHSAGFEGMYRIEF